MVLQRLEEKMGLPPLREISSILSGDGGKRIETILTKLERLSDNQEVLIQATKLMEMIHAMGKLGELDKLDSILKSLPKGKSGATIVSQVAEILKGLDTKIEKLSTLATNIMSRED